MTYEDKYKDRKPEETIQIIKNFFSNNGFNIKENYIYETKINTWTSEIELSYNNNTILISCGKSSTREYCIASAYAELYERFCSKRHLWLQYHATSEIMSQNKQKNNYHFDKEEKIIDFDTAIKNIDINKIISKLQKQDNNNLIKKTYDNICNSKYIGLPFKNISDEKDILYIEPRILTQLYDSTGMAAGNTLEEALVQGMSEMFERHVQTKLLIESSKSISFNIHFNNKYYYLNKKCIKNQKIKNILEILNKNNIDTIIFDLSYNFKLPVIATILINKTLNTFNINFGSHPIFDIAVERTLTEIFQENPYNKTILINEPIRKTKATVFFEDSTYTKRKIIPEILLLNSKEIDSYNKNVFLDNSDYTNIYLLNYYKKLTNNLKYKIYYYNNSLTSKMISIQLFSQEIINPQYYHLSEKKYNDFNFEYFNSIKELYDYRINKNIINKKQLDKNIKTYIYTYQKKHKNFIDFFGYSSFFSIYGINDQMNSDEIITYFNNQEEKEVNLNNIPDIYIPTLSLNVLITKYINNTSYKKKEILKIINFLKKDITVENLDIITNTITSTLITEINSQEYKNYINTFIK